MAKKSNGIKTLEELPAILNAQEVAGVMGLSIPLTYELMKNNNFPSFRVGEKRILISKNAFISWLDAQSKNS